MNEFLDKINDIRFLGVDEFYVKKAYIKRKFEKMEHDDRELYKWYFFYQLCLLKNPLKSLCWDYLEGKCNIDDLTKEYINFCDRRDRICYAKFDN